MLPLSILFRLILLFLIGGIVVALASGLFLVALVVLLPLFFIFVAIGFLYLKSSFHEGEIGQAIENIVPERSGVVLFKRGFGKGASSIQAAVRSSCWSLTLIERGATVVIENVKSGKITVKKLED